MNRVGILAATLGMAACSGGSGDIPEQLEALQISGERAAVTASFAVTGSERDYSLASDVGDAVFDVHTPTGAPLADLDGRELTIELFDEDGRISDGAPLWLAVRSSSTQLADEWFGPGFAALGERVAREDLGGGIRRDHHSVAFETDVGAVEILPGTVETITVDGVLWRAGVVAAYHDEDTSPGNAKCYTYETTLSYELFRVDAEAAPEQLDRDPELDVARTGGGCG